MSPERKKLILNKLSNALHEIISQQGAPQSLALIKTRVPNITGLDKSGNFSVAVDQELINELLIEDNGRFFYETDGLISLKSLLVKEIYKILQKELTQRENKCELRALAEILAKYSGSKFFNLPSIKGKANSLFELDLIKEEHIHYFLYEILMIIRQFPLVFRVDPESELVTYTPPANLKDTVIKIMLSEGSNELTPEIPIDYYYIESVVLLQHLNTSQLYFKEFQSPVTQKDLLVLIKKNSSIFFNGAYELLNAEPGEFFIYKDIAHLIEILKRNESNPESSASFGNKLIAVKFIGENFPLAEAEDFVKRRPYIWINMFEYSQDKKDETPSVITLSSLAGSELDELLMAILPESTEVERWKNENLVISIIEESDIPYDLDEAIKRLFEKLKPVLNLDNESNFFNFTLSAKLEELKAKYKV